ncbi:MAG: multiheme c-type cytochrome, partial [Eubacteriales bacterium]
MSVKQLKTIFVAGAILVFTVAFGSASANQRYSGQTGKSCASCHDVANLPVLNTFGKQFKANGYKIVAPKPAPKPAPKAALKPAPVKPAGPSYPVYVGSERCGQCHKDYYSSWKSTYHSKMVAKRDVGILKDAVINWVYDEVGNQGPTIGNATKDKFSVLDVEYVLDSKWKQRYLVRNSKTGGLQLMNKQFNTLTKQWENYGNANDWDTMCITCHSTGYRLTKYDEKDPAATKWQVAELNVGCEACHGPGSKHAAS